MCCGQNRARAAAAIRSVSTPSVVKAPVPLGPEPRNTGTSTSAVNAPVTVRFVYRGTGALIAIGAATGARYYFSESGQQMAIDIRDRPSLAIVRDLAEL